MDREDLKIIYEVYKPRKFKTLHTTDKYGIPYSLNSLAALTIEDIYKMDVLTIEDVDRNTIEKNKILNSNIDFIEKNKLLYELNNIYTPCYLEKQEYEHTNTHYYEDVDINTYQEIENTNDHAFLNTVGILGEYVTAVFAHEQIENGNKIIPKCIINTNYIISSNTKYNDVFENERSLYYRYLNIYKQIIRNKKLDTLMELINE